MKKLPTYRIIEFDNPEMPKPVEIETVKQDDEYTTIRWTVTYWRGYD